MSTAIIDRAEEVREDADLLDDLWQLTTTRVVEMLDDKVSVRESGGTTRLRLATPHGVGLRRPFDSIYLGRDGQRNYFAVVHEVPPKKKMTMKSVREIGQHLEPLDLELAGTTLALANWHRTHQHCSRCGIETEPARGGWVRRCPSDKSWHFPRTDPATIMLVTDDLDRALLGRRESWPTGWFSTLAGFVEPGESAESAVVREVKEEVGISVDPASVTCLGSQPWPFPSSLMVGYRAHAPGAQHVKPDGNEIREARWFSREELWKACEQAHIQLPGRFSISRHLIESWYGAELPGTWSR